MKAVTLFSGVGCSSEALRSLGFDVLTHDFNADAVSTLQANGFHDAQLGDVRDLDYSHPRYADVEVLEGGPPCQPFSQSHDGNGRFDPRDMIPEFIRAVAEILPKLFVMEEVQTLTWKRHADYLAMVISDLEAIGYRVEGRVLNAADYGQPQARKRLFLVGVREDVAQDRETAVRLPSGWWTIPRDAIEWPCKDDYEPVTMAEYLNWTPQTCRDRNLQVPDKRAHCLWGEFEFLWPMYRASTTVVGSFRPEVQAAPGYRRAGDGPRQSTKGSVVTTLEERIALMGMPSDWKICGSQSSQDLQIGNGVVMPLMRDLIVANT